MSLKKIGECYWRRLKNVFREDWRILLKKTEGVGKILSEKVLEGAEVVGEVCISKAVENLEKRCWITWHSGMKKHPYQKLLATMQDRRLWTNMPTNVIWQGL